MCQRCGFFRLLPATHEVGGCRRQMIGDLGVDLGYLGYLGVNRSSYLVVFAAVSDRRPHRRIGAALSTPLSAGAMRCWRTEYF